jgi:alpha-L-arabinofuranosidase
VSPKDKKFVNPLTQPTEKIEEVPTETPTQISTSTSMDTTTPTSPQTYTYTSEEGDDSYVVERRKRGKQAFEKTHDRWTVWLHKKLKKGLAQLAKEQEVSQSALADEAIADLLKKYGKQ